MGCVFTRSWDVEIKRQFQDIWLKFKNSELANYDRFANNKSKVFEYFYYSTSKIYLMKIKREIARILDKNKNTDLSKPIIKRESKQFVTNILEESDKINELYDEMIKKLKGFGIVSVSRILSQNKESGQPWEDYISDVVRASSIKKCDQATNTEQQDIQCKLRPAQSKVKQSIFQEQVKNSELKSDSSYSLPQDIASLLREHQDPPYQANIDKPQQGNKEERKRQMQEKALVSTYQEKEDLIEDIKRSKGSNEGLLKECLTKEEKIKELTAQIITMKQEIQAKNGNLWKEQAAALKLQVEQYKQQLERINQQKEQISLSSKIMEKKYEDLNYRSTIIVEAAQKSKAFRIGNHLEEIILPPLSESKPSIMQQPIKAEEEVWKKEGKYEIVLRLFSASKLIPDYRNLDKAVEMRTTILNMFSNKPHHSQLIYRSNLATSIKYRDYIDNKENVLILIRMTNDIILGAFAGRFAQNNELSQSFIFSVSESREAMKLTQSRRIKRIDLDVSYINFGNGELRIKVNTLELTTNIGSFQSVYSWENKAVPYERFMGTVEKSLTMKGYQIYQMFFKEGSH